MGTDTGTALNFPSRPGIRRKEAMVREGAMQKRDSLQKVDMGREKVTLEVVEDTAEAMEEVVEIGTIIKEDTMATAVEIIGMEEVDIMRRVVDERGGMMVGTTAEINGEVVLQEVTDLRREATLMTGMKKEEEVTTGGQERRRAMNGRRANLAPRRITFETLKMPKVRHVVCQVQST